MLGSISLFCWLVVSAMKEPNESETHGNWHLKRRRCCLNWRRLRGGMKSSSYCSPGLNREREREEETGKGYSFITLLCCCSSYNKFAKSNSNICLTEYSKLSWHCHSFPCHRWNWPRRYVDGDIISKKIGPVRRMRRRGASNPVRWAII